MLHFQPNTSDKCLLSQKEHMQLNGKKGTSRFIGLILLAAQEKQ